MSIISSAEVADIMLRQAKYLSITEIMHLARRAYPELEVTRNQITNIIRYFNRDNSKATCSRRDDSHPYRYRLYSVSGYKFKVRGRRPDFSRLVVKESLCSTLEREELNHRTVVSAATRIWNRFSSRKQTEALSFD